MKLCSKPRVAFSSGTACSRQPVVRHTACCSAASDRHHQAAAAASDIQSSSSKVAAAFLAAALLTAAPQAAWAEAPPAVYFGNGCFWGRQKDFVETEKTLGRTDPAQISALVGYAGGQLPSRDGKVCYYYNRDGTVYERLGHAEVVQVALSDEEQSAQQEFKKFATTYFNQFRKAPRGLGMMRQDPQDAGPGYRNVVGLPGGVKSPYFQLLQEANVNGMELREGQGNVYQDGVPKENDEINVVWVVDSDQLPFYRAEVYHQFHNGLGKAFPASYTRDLKAAVAKAGKIAPTGCLELPF